uniref:Zinc knuckle CX2CX4HX4C domain-containing protein n=1 Tax=Cannabis sativa TaxID=3483 RepID=A0A803QF05_CANSA
MQNKMAQLWQPGRGMYVKELENNLYLFQFYHEVDIERVMEGSPWTFDRIPLIFERLKQGENPRMVVLNKLEIWVQLHNLSTGFMTERVIQGLGNYLGTFVKSDPNNFIGVWRDYLRIRVKINIDCPLKRKKKLERQGGQFCHALFKYEDLPTFCFICGILGHTERFCEKLFDTPLDQIEKPFNLEMKATPRRRNYTAGAKWLRSGIANRGGGSGFSGGPSTVTPNNHGTETTQDCAQSGIGQAGSLHTKNQGGVSRQSRNNGTEIMKRGDFLLMQKSIIKEGAGQREGNAMQWDNDKTVPANDEETLIVLENKKRRMGLDNTHGPVEASNISLTNVNFNNTSGPTGEVDMEMGPATLVTTKNLFGAGSGSQARREL